MRKWPTLTIRRAATAGAAIALFNIFNQLNVSSSFRPSLDFQTKLLCQDPQNIEPEPVTHQKALQMPDKFYLLTQDKAPVIWKPEWWSYKAPKEVKKAVTKNKRQEKRRNVSAKESAKMAF